MSNWNPCVVRLGKIGRHPNAETLEISKVLGDNTVIFKENQYKEGDLISYLPYDTIVSDHPEFDWLGEKKRIKPVKLRGIFSEGILVPAPPNTQEGDSVVEYYGLKKYEYEEEIAARLTDDAEPAPKDVNIPFYDLENLRKYVDSFQEGEEVIIHEKLDGENTAIFHDGNRLWIRSRHLFKQYKLNSHWWAPANNLGLSEKLAAFPMIVLFAENYGNVRPFFYDAPIVKNQRQRKVRVFDIWDIKARKFLDWPEVEVICQKIGVELVPELYRGPWKADKSLYQLAEGKSTLGEHVKEGFVIRSIPNKFDEALGDRKILKLKGMDYQLKKK